MAATSGSVGGVSKTAMAATSGSVGGVSNTAMAATLGSVGGVSKTAVAAASGSVGGVSKTAMAMTAGVPSKPAFVRDVLETQLRNPRIGRLWQELSGVLPPYFPDEVSYYW